MSTTDDWRPQMVNDLVGNGRRKLLIVGKTGSGKSSICNVIAGLDDKNSTFKVSSSAQGCTGSTQLADVSFDGRTDRPISLIDTIGFDDPDRDTDTKVIQDLISKLKTKCDYMHVFLLVVNGQSPRLDLSLTTMLGYFQEMFGECFWKQTIIIFTRLSMKPAVREERERVSEQTDQKIADEYLEVVKTKFPAASRGLKYVFLDACRDVKDATSQNAFRDSMEQVWNMLQAAPGLPTDKMKHAESEKMKLQRELASQ